jgi:pyridoxamine 5'-phosphate oxidase
MQPMSAEPSDGPPAADAGPGAPGAPVGPALGSRHPQPPLRRADLDPDPIAQFEAWFGRAREQVPLAEAMTLATVDQSGSPDARMVLLKGVDERGFRFFTNRSSVKGAQLAARPVAALILYWREQDRQVRVRGAVEELGEQESDRYFATRPRDSQIGAWASPQSAPIDDREELARRVAAAEERFAGGEVPRPPHWGGFVVVPGTLDFWQGQEGRLHDRFRYRRSGPGEPWHLERLAP